MQSPDYGDDEQELFVEFLLERDFTMVATSEPSSLPGDKDILLIHTSNNRLFRRMRSWARRNNTVILHNTEAECPDLDYLAVIIDSNLLGTISIPNVPAGRFINAGLGPQTIEKILESLQEGGHGRRSVRKR